MKMSEVARDPVISERSSPLCGSPDVVPCNEKIANTMCENSGSELISALVTDETETQHCEIDTQSKNMILDYQKRLISDDDDARELGTSDEILVDNATAADEAASKDEIGELVDNLSVEIYEDSENLEENDLFDNDLDCTLTLNSSLKANDLYLPDLIPAFADNSNTTASLEELDVNESKPIHAEINEILVAGEVAEETLEKFSEEAIVNVDSYGSPLRSVLKKANSSTKKNLRVTFSDSEIIFVEKVPDLEPCSSDEWNSEAVSADWDQWEAFSNALKLSLSSFSDDDLSCTLPSGETDNTTVNENGIQITSKPVDDSTGHHAGIAVEFDQNSKSVVDEAIKATVASTPLSEDEYFQSLTEANVRKHESLLINRHDGHESDSESTSSQDTIIMMTTEESIRNQELIEQSQRRYKQMIHGSSSSSSHDSDEGNSQSNLVMRSNSSVRRCLERTALRRSLTRCAEIRRRTREDLAGNREKENSSLIEKLKVLCDVSTLQHTEENVDTSSVKGNTLTESMPLPQFDLQQMQQLMTRNSPIHKLYSSGNDISVPGDVRQWKIFSKLAHDASSISSVDLPSTIAVATATRSQSFDSALCYAENIEETLQDVNFGALNVGSASSLYEGGSDDPGAAELEYFVQQDQDRTERLKRRYNSGDEASGDEYGFYRRPSVRGIKPTFSSTTEIIEQLQKQASVPKLLQSSRSHLTWPNLENSTTSQSGPKSQSYNSQNVYRNKNGLETVMEHETFYSPSNRYTYCEDSQASASLLMDYNKAFQSQKLPAAEFDKRIFISNDDQSTVSDTYPSSPQMYNAECFSCPPYIPPPAPRYVPHVPDEPDKIPYRQVDDINNRFYSPSPQSNVFPVLQNKTNLSSFMFDV